MHAGTLCKTSNSPEMWSARDYYPFGQEMSERTWQAGVSFRFGFNGKETDSETRLQDYGFRIYNPAIAKFLSVDPLAPDYPWYTPYQFAGNTPIWAIDLDGLEEYTVISWKNYTKVILRSPQASPKVNYYETTGVDGYHNWINSTEKNSNYLNSTEGRLPVHIWIALNRRADVGREELELRAGLKTYGKNTPYESYDDHNGGIGFPSLPILTKTNNVSEPIPLPQLSLPIAQLRPVPQVPNPPTIRPLQPGQVIERLVGRGNYDWLHNYDGTITPNPIRNPPLMPFLNQLVTRLNASPDVSSITIDLVQEIDQGATPAMMAESQRIMNRVYLNYRDLLRDAGLSGRIQIKKGDVGPQKATGPIGQGDGPTIPNAGTRITLQ
jgi:RHS repeat-associated protein